jgi:hypothetical protein
MIHHHRMFAVGVVDNLDELVEKLTDRTWTLCTCFEYQGLLLANDSFSEDGAQEYAVYKEGRQIESLTVSWMTRESLREVITGLLEGAYEPLEFRPIQPLRTEPASGHSCALCR